MAQVQIRVAGAKRLFAPYITNASCFKMLRNQLGDAPPPPSTRGSVWHPAIIVTVQIVQVVDWGFPRARTRAVLMHVRLSWRWGQKLVRIYLECTTDSTHSQILQPPQFERSCENAALGFFFARRRGPATGAS